MKKIIKGIIYSNERLIFFYNYLKVLRNRIFLSNNYFAEKFLERKYEKLVGKKLKFSRTIETFTEKIQYRKLYGYNQLYTKCSDKFLVREYVRKKIGEKYLIPLYLVTDKLTLESWEKIPNAFVVKPNHDSGNIEIIRDKKSIDSHEKKRINLKMNLALKINFGWLTLEKHYLKIKPKIIVEKLLLNKNGELPKDYKFYCFKNKILVQVIARDLKTHEMKMKFFDENWQDIGIKREKEELNGEIKPKNFEKMIEIAKKLSEDFNYVRVDLYNIDGVIYFGELTFTPASGFMKFEPDTWDKRLGDYWINE